MLARVSRDELVNECTSKKAEQEKKDFTEEDELSKAPRVSAEFLFLHLFTAVGSSSRVAGVESKRTASWFPLNDYKTGDKNIPHSFTGDRSLTSQNNSEIKCSHLRR